MIMNQIKIKTESILIKFSNVNYIKSFLLMALVFTFFNCSYNETQTVAKLNNIVMQDEFSTDGSLDSNLWNFDIGTGTNGWGNNELQYYTDRPENATIQNGILVITAKQESFNGSSYTSARIQTKDKFEQAYGRFEARIKLPSGQGIWPAFWLLGENCCEETKFVCPDGSTDLSTCIGQEEEICIAPANGVIWPQCGEIDIMEYRGQEPTKIHGSIHGPGYSGANPITKSYTLENDRFDTGFHVFGIEWSPEYINYYVGLVALHYRLHISDKDLSKYIKMHIDEGLSLFNEELTSNSNLDGFEFLVGKIGDNKLT